MNAGAGGRAGGLLVALLMIAGAARAQQGDAAAAAELFQQGRQALQDGRFDVACSRFSESQRLDPKVGTLINLAECRQGEGKLALALHAWDDAERLAQATADRRVAYIVDMRAALAPRVPRLSIRRVPELLADARVKVDDDVELAGADLTVPFPVDPGAHVVRVIERGHVDGVFHVTMDVGGSVALDARPGAVLALPAQASPPVGTQRMLAFVAGGLGVVGIGIGSVFGAKALSARNDPNCSGGLCTNENDAQTQRSGVTAGNVSTVAFLAAGSLLAGGVVLWLTAPRTGAARSTPTAWLRCTPGSQGAHVGLGAAW